MGRKSQSSLCGDEAATKELKEGSSNGMLKLDFTRAWSAKIPGRSQNGCFGGRVSGMALKDVDQSVKYDCKKTLSEQVQPDKMSSWMESVLAAEAKKAGSASEDTRLTPRSPFLTVKLT